MNTGIICEFNPFHKGHKYLFDKVKENNSNIICVMSGNFVQRGEFAVYDKFKRAAVAIKNGADLVIELPTVYSTLSAEGFAKYATQILEATGICDIIAFGAECDDINSLSNISRQIKEKENLITQEMKKGISYPQARSNIIKSEILNEPNNILAIEYIKNTSIDCVAYKRIGKGHDSNDSQYSAKEIRSKLPIEDICSMKNCESAILAKLRTMSKDDLKNTDDVSEGLENRIYEAIRKATSLEELYDLIKTKRYTHSRIRRIILRTYLGITKDYPKKAPYIKILGFSSQGKVILNQMKKSSNLPIISRFADIEKLNSDGRELLMLECKCTDLYNLGYKKPLPCGTEQRSKIYTQNN